MDGWVNEWMEQDMGWMDDGTGWIDKWMEQGWIGLDEWMEWDGLMNGWNWRMD